MKVIGKGKGKAVTLQAWSDPEGSRKLRFPHYNGTGRWYGGQPYAPAALTPRKFSWYPFLLEAESAPGPQCDRKDYVNEQFQLHHLESNKRPSDL